MRPSRFARVEAAAQRAGALVEFAAATPASLPVEAESVDVVVLAMGMGSLSEADRSRAVDESMRVLRPGGRTIVVEGGKARTGSFASLSGDTIMGLLTAVGAKAVRMLATVDGITYYEARKARVAPC